MSVNGQNERFRRLFSRSRVFGFDDARQIASMKNHDSRDSENAVLQITEK
jgi:hypothetical protein